MGEYFVIQGYDEQNRPKRVRVDVTGGAALVSDQLTFPRTQLTPLDSVGASQSRIRFSDAFDEVLICPNPGDSEEAVTMLTQEVGALWRLSSSDGGIGRALDGVSDLYIVAKGDTPSSSINSEGDVVGRDGNETEAQVRAAMVHLRFDSNAAVIDFLVNAQHMMISGGA